MKKFLLVLVLMLSVSFMVVTANANAPKAEKKSVAGNAVNNQTRTRYVRLHGRRYRVTYRLFRRNGRLYYRIVSYSRA